MDAFRDGPMNKHEDLRFPPNDVTADTHEYCYVAITVSGWFPRNVGVACLRHYRPRGRKLCPNLKV